MAAWRYEISLRVLKKYFTSERSERVKYYFSTLEEKFRISAWPCNILDMYFCLLENSAHLLFPPTWNSESTTCDKWNYSSRGNSAETWHQSWVYTLWSCPDFKLLKRKYCLYKDIWKLRLTLIFCQQNLIKINDHNFADLLRCKM